jgi:hypothetical protein
VVRADTIMFRTGEQLHGSVVAVRTNQFKLDLFQIRLQLDF